MASEVWLVFDSITEEKGIKGRADAVLCDQSTEIIAMENCLRRSRENRSVARVGGGYLSQLTRNRIQRFLCIQESYFAEGIPRSTPSLLCSEPRAVLFTVVKFRCSIWPLPLLPLWHEGDFLFADDGGAT